MNKKTGVVGGMIETNKGFKPIQNLKIKDKIIGRMEDDLEMLWSGYFEGEIEYINDIGGINLQLYCKNKNNDEVGFFTLEELDKENFVLLDQDFTDIEIVQIGKSPFKGMMYFVKSSLGEAIINNCIIKIN